MIGGDTVLDLDLDLDLTRLHGHMELPIEARKLSDFQLQ